VNPEVRLKAVRVLGLTRADDDDGILRGLAKNTDTAIATEAEYALDRILTRDFG